MTTSKTAAKGAEARRPRSEPPEELQAAYQIHTLAQMMYGRIYATESCPVAYGAPWPGRGETPPVYGQAPGAAWVQAWPPVYGQPFGWGR